MTETKWAAPPLPFDSLPFDRGHSPLDPPAPYAQWREDEPIRRVSLANGSSHWLVSRYDDIRAILSDPRISSDRAKPGFPSAVAADPTPLPGNLVSTDPPVHDVLRRMLTKTFMIKNIERLRPAISTLTKDLLDAMERQSPPVDLVANFALPLPSQVICELFGVPYADRDVFQVNSATIVDLTKTGEEMHAARTAMSDYLIKLIEAKDRNPGDDLFSELAVTRVRTGELTKEEVGGMGALLLLAGHETTANMIGLSTVALLRQPEQLRKLVDEPAAVPAAVEELLRYLSIVHVGLRRVALDDVEIGDVTIRAGEGVIIPIQSANRDPRVFDVPDRLDVSRDARHHVAFGYGIHQCLGQPLARAELQIALPALFSRFPTLRVAVPFEEIAFRESTSVYGVRELPVTW